MLSLKRLIYFPLDLEPLYIIAVEMTASVQIIIYRCELSL